MWVFALVVFRPKRQGNISSVIETLLKRKIVEGQYLQVENFAVDNRPATRLDQAFSCGRRKYNIILLYPPLC